MAFPEERGMGGWGWARGSVGAISGGSHVPVMEEMQGVQGIPGAATQVGVVQYCSIGPAHVHTCVSVPVV